MIVLSQNIKINRSASEVFDFISNYENDVLWRKNVKSMQITNRKPGIIGSETEECLKFLGSTYVTAAGVTEYEERKRIAFKSIKGKVKASGYRELYPLNGCTEFRYYLEVEQAGFMKFTEGILKYFFGKQLTKDLLTLKTILEQ